MNHIYRNIWNASTGTWTAVAENATAHGKSSGGGVKRAAVRAALPAGIAAALFGAGLVQPAGAQPVSSVVVSPGGAGNANTYVAPNGVSVVNIATPNAAGLSHNRYTTYNVNANGLVLNNGNNDVVARQSQLAGQVTANMNLTTQAGTILNEVVANNRSTLAGFTEVLGGRADVILANPYGITCSGCGFINTDRVTLTTGSPFLAANGGLGGFAVGQGDILITGTGLNATAQQVLDLVTRALRVEAPVNGADVSVATGLNRWNYTTRAVDGNAVATGAAPTYAIDTSALGGMYANRIRLLATEAGVGVRMAGDAAASAGDFTLSAAGRVELQNRISATGDVAVATTSGASDALALNGASLSATGRAAIAATGGASLSGSALVAGTDLSVAAASLLETAAASNAPNADRRSAGGAIDLAIGGRATLGATSWLAGGDLRGRFGSLATTAATQLFSRGGTLIASADNGDLALGLAVLQSAGDLRLSASGRIGVATGGTLQSRGGDLALTAGNGIVNAGTVSADAGRATLRADGSIANAGTLHAAQDIDIADLRGGATQAVGNTGQLIADRALKLRAADVTNAAGALLQAQAGSDVAAASIDNQGTWLLSQRTGAVDRVVVVGTLRNGGTMRGAGSLAVDAGSVDNSGALQATTGLALAAGGLANSGALAVSDGAATLRVDRSIDNSGVLYAQGRLDIADRQGSASAAFSNTGLVMTDAALALRTAALSNVQVGGNVASGRIQSGTAIDIAASSLRNAGTLLAGTSLAVGAGGDVTNSGRVQAATGSVVTAASLGNTGTWLLSTQAGAADRIAVGGSLVNSGTLQSEAGATLAAGSVANSGVVLAGTALAASTAGAFDNAGGVLQAGTALDVNAGGRFGNTAGALVKAAGIAIRSTGFDNAGIVTADAGTQTLRVDGALANSGTLYARQALDIADRSGGAGESVTNTGTMLTDAALALRGAAVSNSQVGADASTGRIQAASASTVTAASLDNGGSWLLSTQTGASNSVTVGGRLANGGRLQGSGDTTVTAGSVDNGGVIYAVGDLKSSAQGDFANRGTVQAGRTATVSTGGTFLNAAGALVKAVDASLQADGLDNAGNLVASGGAAVLRVGSRLDNSGGIYAGTSLDIADRNGAGSESVTNSGVLLAGTTLGLKAASLANTQRGIDTATGRIQATDGSRISATSLSNTGTWLLSTQAGAADMVAVSGRLTNNGTLQSQRSADISASGIDNSGALYAASALGVTTKADFRNLSAGIVQAGAALRLSTGTAFENRVNALVKGASVDLSAGSITNGGALAATAGRATLQAAGLLNNTGLIRGEGTTVGAADLDNSGNWLLSTQATASDVVGVSGTLRNDGLMQSLGSATYTAATLRTGGTLLAAGDLRASAATVNVDATGTLQAGGTLHIDASSALDNAGGATAKGRLLGNALAISAGSLTNGGIVQGGGSKASTISVANTLTNSATGVITGATTANGAA
ncbi:MAG: filamentous hemagglutinin N-terminal domain-containing protein, partial [Variovorax sp.]